MPYESADANLLNLGGRPVMICNRPILTLIDMALTAGFITANYAQDEVSEHPVIKPMTGATLSPRSTFVEFGRLPLNFREGGRSVRMEAEGKHWHLEYQLEDTTTGRDEIMANYESEARRIGGDILNRTATRLLFRLTRPGGGLTWCRLDTRAGGRYILEIIDEAGLDLSIEFDADALLEALDRDGQVAIYGILFAVDRADLRPGSGQVLDTIATILKADSALRLEVAGHTDSTGSAEGNRGLSLERAGAVVNALALYGIDQGRLTARGYGPDQPVADNATAAGRQLNRRVELIKQQ
jgi:flagellar motor protein MotB